MLKPVGPSQKRLLDILEEHGDWMYTQELLVVYAGWKDCHVAIVMRSQLYRLLERGIVEKRRVEGKDVLGRKKILALWRIKT